MLKSGMVLESGDSTAKKKTTGLQSGQVLGEVKVTDKFNPYVTQKGEKIINDTLNNPDKMFKQNVLEGNPVPHVNPTAENKTNAFKNAVLSTAKKAIQNGRDFTTQEINAVKKYGISSVLPDSATAEYDIFADNNPLNKARLERVKTIIAKQNKGESITEDENNTLETFKLINEYKNSGGKASGTLESKLHSKDSALMTGNTTENAYKMQDVKAKKLYNDATYGNDTIKIGNKEYAVNEGDTAAKALRAVQNAGKRTDLYINAGLEQYAQGLNTTADVLTGKSPEKIADSPYGAYSTANAMLKQYYTEHGEELNSIIQDTVTNIANNAPGMVVGAVTGVPLLGQATFGISVFGNAYKEGTKLGIYDPTRLLGYSLATTASEVGLGYLIGGLPGVGGVLSGEVIEGLSKNVSSAIAKAATKVVGNALGEFIEEGTQSLLSPVLQKYILGADVETVVDDPLGALSDAAYEGFIGALTSVLTGGIGSYTEAIYERNIQASGKYYKQTFSQNGADVKNVAKFFEESSADKSKVKEFATAVTKGDTSDLAVGRMMIAVARETQESNKALFTRIGENVRNSEGGIAAVVSSYEEAVNENKSIFPDEVEKLYKEVSGSENASNELVGEFALKVETYAPRAAIMGDIVGKTFGAETETELAEAEVTNADTATDTGIKANESVTDTNIGDSVFTERSAQKPEYDMIKDGLNYGTGKVRLSQDQLKVASTGRALGHKVVFENTQKTQGFKSDGYIETDGTIHIDYNCKNPVEFVLKHELTHFGEDTEEYKSFAKEVKNSKAYEQWINKKVGGVEKPEIKSAIYRKRIMDNYAANGVKLTPTQAEAELIADFSGEVLFRADGSGLKSIMSDMSNSKRSKFANFFRDFITYLKAKLTRNKAITAEVLKLERLFNEALSAAEQKNTAAEGEEKYSFAGEKAKTADKTLLESAKERIENGEDSETVRQETGWFKGYDGKWRFEISDREMELNDKPDFEVRGDNSSGFYRVAQLEEVLKHDNLFKAYPDLKDYTVIVQETNPGTQGSFFKDDNQIVLSNTLFQKESEKYKNSVNEKYEEIRKIEQSPEFKEYNKFYDDLELAEIDAEQWLVLEKEAEKKFYSSEIGKRYYKLKWGKSEVPRYELGWSDAAKSVLMHEIQHAVQDIEGFSSGANPQYWANKTSESEKNYTSAKRAFEKKAEGLVDVLYRYGFYDKYGEDFDILSDSGIDTAKSYLEEIEAPRGAIDMVEDLKELETERDNAFELWRELKKRSSGELYKSTAGELESRDVSNRLTMTDEERKNTRPDIDRTDVVFADGGVSYSLRPGAEADVEKALRDENYTEDVYLTESSPSIIVSQKGTRNLPMLMKASHIRENVFTEQEAKGLSLKVDEHTHYHGLGKTLFLKIIDGLNDVKLAYRGTKNASNPSRRENYFLLISQYKDANGNTVNVPVYIDEKGQYNRVFIDTNKIATVFGRDNFSSYIQKEIEKGNLVRIKNKSTQASELTALIAGSYSKNAFTNNNIPQSDTVVKNNISENTEKYSENIKKRTSRTAALQNKGSDRYVTSSTDSISNSAENVKKTISENAQKADKKFSIPDRQSELLKKYDNGEITREEYLEESNKNWEEAVNTYGTFKEGENAKVKIPVPKAVRGGENTAQFTKTVIESGHLSSRMIEDIGAEMLEGGFEYTPVTDEEAQAAADEAVNSGKAETIWKNAVNASKLLNKDAIAVGEKLLMQAIKAKDTRRVVELTAELSDVLVRNGQNVQAASMFKKMTGAGKLVTIQRFVDKLNRDRLKKYNDFADVIKLDERIAEQVAESEPGEDITGIYNDALRDVASQTEATFLDKWNAWRYMSMLTNPTTHIRNIVGNAIFTPSVRMKDFAGAMLEKMFVEEGKRTKVIKAQKKYRDFAEKDAARLDVKNALANGGQYSEASISQEISEYQKVFKTRWLEFVRKGNSNLLEAEDAFFKNIHYKHALAGFLQARGIDLNNVTEKTLWKARAYAMDEALKATFNDANSVARILNNAAKGNKYADVVINGILPFKKTPVNIVRRGIEYSPIGLLSTITKGTYNLKKGNITATEYIDGMGAGISGTAVFAMGTLLASLGLVTGSFGDDEEDKFRKLNGEQEYALQIGGKSYTIDWAAPACIPFFIGVELINEMRKEKEDFSVADVSDVMWNSFEPILELSMLSGVQSMIESVKYADNGRDLISLTGNITKSYFSQGLPTIGGKLARTADSKRRSNYIDKNSKLSEFSQGVVNNVKAKIPFLENMRPEYVDEWGRTESNGNIITRIAENFLSPGYASNYGYDELSEELLRISNVAEVKNDEDLNVLPQYAQKSFSVNGETKYLTADEYVKYAKAKGSYSRKYVEKFMESKTYDKLTDEERAYVITKLYSYANAKAKSEVSDYDISEVSTFKKAYNWEKSGNSVITYYVGKALTKTKEDN